MRLAGGWSTLSASYKSTRSLKTRVFTPLVSKTAPEDTPAHPKSIWSVRARGLLRAILREASYLPDRQAREYVAKHAIAQFKRHSLTSWAQRNDPTLETRLQDRHVATRRALKVLCRANSGEHEPLLKILLATYGRVGKRRHELLEPWLRHDEQDTRGTHKLTPALRDCIASQIRASPPTLTRRNPKSLEPDIPALNSYMRPMPQSRVRNMTKKWYDETLRRFLPPLPVGEWSRLKRLASGREKVEVPKRRTAIAAASPAPSALEMVLIHGKGKVHRNVFEQKRLRKLTARLMRRLWARVFSQCSVAEWNSTKNRWELTWGQYALHTEKPSFEARSDQPATGTVPDTVSNAGETASTVRTQIQTLERSRALPDTVLKAEAISSEMPGS